MEEESIVYCRLLEERGVVHCKQYYWKLLEEESIVNWKLLEENSIVSQMATYWFVIAWFDNQSVQKSKVRQAAKDVVKSEVYPQTYSS